MDGTNVNGWHWQSINRLDWSKGKIAELVEGVASEEDGAQVRFTKLTSLTGEAMLTKRKLNKVFLFYDLTIEFSWEGKVELTNGASEESNGKLRITEFATTSEAEEVVWEVTTAEKKTSEAAQRLQRMVEGLKPEVFRRLERYVAQLEASAHSNQQ
jgi:activator of HSP90 ATPase